MKWIVESHVVTAKLETREVYTGSSLPSYVKVEEAGQWHGIADIFDDEVESSKAQLHGDENTIDHSWSTPASWPEDKYGKYTVDTYRRIVPVEGGRTSWFLRWEGHATRHHKGYETEKKALAAAKSLNDRLALENKYQDIVIKACANPGACTVTDREIADIGMVVEVHGQGKRRLAVVIGGKPGSPNIKVMFTTPTALERGGFDPVIKTVSRKSGS